MTVVVWILAAVILGVGALQGLVWMRARRNLGRAMVGLEGDLGKAVASGAKVLAYFYSPSCSACRAQTPVVESLRTTHVNVYVVNVAEDPGTARAFGVMATPSTVLLEGGVVREFRVGTVPPEILLTMLQ